MDFRIETSRLFNFSASSLCPTYIYVFVCICECVLSSSSWLNWPSATVLKLHVYGPKLERNNVNEKRIIGTVQFMIWWKLREIKCVCVSFLCWMQIYTQYLHCFIVVFLPNTLFMLWFRGYRCYCCCDDCCTKLYITKQMKAKQSNKLRCAKNLANVFFTVVSR